MESAAAAVPAATTIYPRRAAASKKHSPAEAGIVEPKTLGGNDQKSTSLLLDDPIAQAPAQIQPRRPNASYMNPGSVDPGHSWNGRWPAPADDGRAGGRCAS